jgi:uncharacterized delta-60 repeat protein/gliding motility-associated-like protein
MNRILFLVAFLFICSENYAQPGTLDNTFGTGGIVTTTISSFSAIGDIAVQPDGKIVACGVYTDFATSLNSALARYNYDGSLDNSFGTGGIVMENNSGELNSIALQNDGKIVVSGVIGFPQQDIYIARYNSNGTLDNTFGTNGKVITQISDHIDFSYDVAIQNDGKILVTGYYSSSSTGYNSILILIRYNSNGTLDNTLGTAGIVTTAIGSSHSYGFEIAIQPDGKILVCGSTNIDNNTYYRDFLIIRYNANGTLDNTFDNDGIVTLGNGNFLDQFNSIVVCPDGKIVAGGGSNNNLNNIFLFAICRFNSNGSLDNSFGNNGIIIMDPNSPDVATISKIALQGDNKIVAGGFYSNTPVSADFIMLRYNNSGTLDNIFGINGIVKTSINVWDQANTIALANNRIYLAGMSYAGPPPTSVKFTIAAYNNCIAQPLVINNVDTNICKGVLFNGNNIYTDTIYSDTLQGVCFSDSLINNYKIHIINADTIIIRDTTICYGSVYKNKKIYVSFLDTDTLITPTVCGARLNIIKTQVNVTPEIKNSFGKDSVLCKSGNIVLTAYSPALSYLWQDNSRGPTYTAANPGVFWVEVTDTFNCKTRDTIIISLSDLYLNIFPDTTIFPQSNVLLSPATNGSVIWNPDPTLSCSICQNTIATPLATTMYQLISTKDNCTLNATVKVIVGTGYYLYVPTAFSPNKDYLNDIFKVITNISGPFLFEIYNRWGEKIFSTTKTTVGWDGSYKHLPQPIGNYIYVIKYQEKSSSPQKQIKGTVLLVN